MQLGLVLDRSPVGVLRGNEDARRFVDLGEVGAHGLDDGLDLAGMNAPHAQVAEFEAAAAGVLAHHVKVLDLGGDVVRRHDAVSQRSGSDLGLGAGHQRMGVLSW